jgi:DNA-binding transcriptional ArsR family regulator
LYIQLVEIVLNRIAQTEILELINLSKLFIMQMEDLTADQLEKAASLLKAMAHPMRIAIIKYLDGGKQLTVTEIHELLGIEQSTTSHHLGILKDKGVLVSKRDGKNTYYAVKNNSLNNIIECVKKCTC